MNNKTKQKELFYLGYYDYKIDGIFGTRSKKATREFQRDYGLGVDGIFGKKTTSKMYEVWKNIQSNLNKVNNSSLVIDGFVGPKTIAQTKLFQSNFDMSTTGIMDKSSLSLLNEEVNKDFIKPKYPLNYIGITQAYKKGTHNGIDLGWNRNYGGASPQIFAPLDMKVLVNSTASDAGNYIVGVSAYDANNDILFRFLHLKYTSSYKVGDIIPIDTSFGIMGSTGRSTGNHLHFETWIVPKNYNYKFSDRNKYLKDPIKYIYIYPEQIVSAANTYDLLYF